MRELELAELPRDGAGEGAALVAEELALEQLARQRRAVDRDERLRAARTRGVDVARHQLLAGAALALEQDRRAARRDARGDREHALQRRGARDDAALAARRAAGVGAGAAALARPARARMLAHQVQEIGRRERLGEEVERAELHRRDRVLDRAVRRHHHHRQAGMPLLHRRQQLGAGHARHPHVGEHERVAAVGERGQRRGARRRPRSRRSRCRSSTSVRPSRMARSSSTTRIRSIRLLLRGVGRRGRCRRGIVASARGLRQRQHEDRAARARGVGRGRIASVPPCAATAARATASPSPVPRSLVVKNGAKIALLAAGGNAGPAVGDDHAHPALGRLDGDRAACPPPPSPRRRCG